MASLKRWIDFSARKEGISRATLTAPTEDYYYGVSDEDERYSDFDDDYDDDDAPRKKTIDLSEITFLQNATSLDLSGVEFQDVASKGLQNVI